MCNLSLGPCSVFLGLFSVVNTDKPSMMIITFAYYYSHRFLETSKWVLSITIFAMKFIAILIYVTAISSNSGSSVRKCFLLWQNMCKMTFWHLNYFSFFLHFSFIENRFFFTRCILIMVSLPLLLHDSSAPLLPESTPFPFLFRKQTNQNRTK